jgi:tetratricopeptide (TPR) repeat protein
VALLSSIGCRKTDPPKRGDLSAALSASALAKGEAPRGSTGATASAAPRLAPAVATATRLVDDEEKERLKQYWQAMGQGRMATVKKAFPTAIAGFDRALEVMPDDARAYAERGYAQLMAKNFRLAREDFDRAAERTDDRKLLAQIWFNYGLTAEEEGRAEDARSAFARSNEMNPTAAASKRLGGIPTCTARVTKRQDEDGAETNVRIKEPKAADWLGIFDIMAQPASDLVRPATPDAARSLLCRNGGCVLEPEKGAALRLESTKQTVFGAVIAAEDQKLRPFPRMLVVKSGPCGLDSKVDVTHQQPLQVHVEYSQMVERFGDPDGHDCKEGQSASCTRQCRKGTRVVRDYLFNVNGTGIPLTVEQWTPPDGKAEWVVTVSGSDARINGGGCDISWSLK